MCVVLNPDPVSKNIRAIEPQPLIQGRNLLNLLIAEVESVRLEVLLQPINAVPFGDDDNISLLAPAQWHLTRRLAVFLGDALDNVDLEQGLGLHRAPMVHLEEALRPDRRVARHGDIILLG
jgi:hypothetical protein